MTDEAFRTFLVSYGYEGARYSIELKARDIEDAQARLSRLCFATLDGEIAAKIPVPGWAGRLLARVWQKPGAAP